MDFKAIAAVFVVLAVILGGTTAYFAANPTTVTPTQTLATTRLTTVSASGPAGYAVNIAYKQGIGYYLTNGTGFTLYFRNTDTPNSGKTTCVTSTCEKNWPAFYSPELNLPPGLNSSDFSTITPYNNTKIVTYDGYALFYWIGDKAPGDTSGQGVGNFYAAHIGQPGLLGLTLTTTSLGTTTTTSSSVASTTTTTSTTTKSSSTCTGYYC